MQGKISASGIAELMTGGKTAQTYLLKKAKEIIGFEDKLQTREMYHGIVNQIEAFENILYPIGGYEWFDEYLPIDDRCGASPDVIGLDSVLDIKCPYYIDTYVDQVRSLPKKYYYQVQMQMMAYNCDKGGVLLYLTSPEMDEYGNKKEYPYDLADRHKLHLFGKDEEVQIRIMDTVNKYYPILESWVEILNNAKILDIDECFYLQISGKLRLRKLKTATDIEDVITDCVRVGNEFYY